MTALSLDASPIAAAVVATTLCAGAALAHAQAAKAGDTSMSRYVVLGCLRQTVGAASAGASARPRYTLSDTRTDPPTTYTLDGDRETLQLHIGHVVEVAGPLTRGPAGGLTLKVDSLVYVASACPGRKQP